MTLCDVLRVFCDVLVDNIVFSSLPLVFEQSLQRQNLENWKSNPQTQNIASVILLYTHTENYLPMLGSLCTVMKFSWCDLWKAGGDWSAFSCIKVRENFYLILG